MVNLGSLTVYWVTYRDDIPVIEELSMRQLLNTVDYIQEQDLKEFFTSRKEAEKELSARKRYLGM